MAEHIDRFQLGYGHENGISHQTYGIVHELPPENFSPERYIPDPNAALNETVRMIESDTRLHTVAQLVRGHTYQEARATVHDETAEYGYFFDRDGKLVMRINQENGDVSLPATLLLSEIQPTENRISDQRTKTYREMLKRSIPPPISVAGLTQPYRTFRIIEGNSRFAAAKQAKIEGLPSWVFLRNAQVMQVRVPLANHENPLQAKLAQRFAEAMSLIQK